MYCHCKMVNVKSIKCSKPNLWSGFTNCTLKGSSFLANMKQRATNAAEYAVCS